MNHDTDNDLDEWAMRLTLGVIALLVGGVLVLLFIYFTGPMSDPVWALLDATGDWLEAHEQGINAATIWAVCIASALLAIVKGITWLVIRGQRDRTGVGERLRGQKAAEMVMFACWATLYGIAVWAVYHPFTFGIWERLTVRAALVVSLYGAVYHGIRLVLALRDQRWGQPDTTARQAATDVRQAATEVRQDERGAAQDARDTDWEASHD